LSQDRDVGFGVISRHFGKTARWLLSPTADIGGAIPITEYHHVAHR
jgi:hypothetical protein